LVFSSIKFCENCNKLFGEYETNKWNWSRKRFCSYKCKEIKRLERRKMVRNSNRTPGNRVKYRRNLYRTFPNVKLKEKIRSQTYYEYGSIQGYELHHFEPYNKDEFFWVPKKEHHKWDALKEGLLWEKQ